MCSWVCLLLFDIHEQVYYIVWFVMFAWCVFAALCVVSIVFVFCIERLYGSSFVLCVSNVFFLFWIIVLSWVSLFKTVMHYPSNATCVFYTDSVHIMFSIQSMLTMLFIHNLMHIMFSNTITHSMRIMCSLHIQCTSRFQHRCEATRVVNTHELQIWLSCLQGRLIANHALHVE